MRDELTDAVTAYDAGAAAGSDRMSAADLAAFSALEINREVVVRGQRIGAGAEGVVYEGTYHGQPCAIKAMHVGMLDTKVRGRISSEHELHVAGL
jgi:RIO-like serine/threonine protein kinase